MTYLEAINKVLRGLRESTVESLSEEQTLRIGQHVNEAKQDLEDMGPWHALRTTLTGSLTQSVATLDLTASTNDRSYLFVDQNMPQAFITTVDEEHRLQVVQQSELDALYALDPDAQEDVPYAVSFSRGASGITAKFFPTPDAEYTYQFVFVVPQDDLDSEDDEFSIPAYPIWREALARAMEERGEDFSGPVDRVFERARQARNDAIMRDFGADPMTFEAS